MSVKAIIVADGDVAARALASIAGADGHDEPPLIVAADGGSLKAELLGLVPDVVVGDLDSLSTEMLARLRGRGTEIIGHPAEKDASDTQLAVELAVSRGAQQLVIVGALGGRRLDHALANMLLLGLPMLTDREVSLVDGPATLRLMGLRQPDRLKLSGAAGDLVSLLPLSEVVEGVRTNGLRYVLHDEPLDLAHSRGLSNVMVRGQAEVRLRTGRLAVIHTAQQGLEGNDG